MIDVSKILESIKSILDSDKRYIILVMLFSGIIITYLYQDKQATEALLLKHEANCTELLVANRKQAEIENIATRTRMQTQLDNFIEESNKKTDSLYQKLYESVRLSNQKVRAGIKDLNEIKNDHEDHN